MRSWITLIALALASVAAGCGGGSWYAARSEPARTAAAYGGYAATGAYTTTASAGYAGSDSGGGGGSTVEEERLAEAPPADGARLEFSGDTLEGLALGQRGPELHAQADRRARETSAATGATTPPQEQAQETATDAVDTSGPLLIYTAVFHVAVYEVQESQARIVAGARELGGFVFSQSDDRVVVRVPAPRFRAMLEQIEQAGDVEHRDVQAQDVSEEFHDVEIRIRNLEAMRTRVEALLAQARTVEEALEVEQQLQRITQELELLRGRQRFLADRVAFSTITVLFRPRPREALDQPDVFELPFPWLDELGLGNLLDLRS